MNRRRILFVCSLLPFLLILVFGQTSPATEKPASTPQPLLRIERVREGEAVCALVQSDGSYRLEKLVRVKGDMYAGITDADHVTRLRAILAEAQLRSISQDKIKADLFTDTVDGLDLAIWRDRGWQLLSFRNSSGRKPFKDALDPLLDWFQDLQKKRPAATQVHGPATRCLPPSELQPRTELQTRNEVPPAPKTDSAAEIVVSMPTFLFRFQSAQFQGGAGRSVVVAKMENTCTILYLDGTYHSEKRTQATDGSSSEHSYGGRVNTDSLASLKTVLDAFELKNAVSDVGDPRPAQEAERITVSIPRDDGLQRLTFTSEFNTRGNPGKIGGMNNLTYHAGSQKVLDPLKHWMKDHTNRQEGATGADNTINDCVPTH